MSSNRVIFSGRLYSSEEWSCGFTYSAPNSEIISDYADLQRWAIAIGTLNGGKIAPTSLLSLLSASGTITAVRTEARSSQDKLLQAGEFTPSAPIVGATVATKPFQTALVLSIRTGRPGRSFRGRAFWPALGATLSTSTGRVSSPTTATIASETAQFVANVGAAAGSASPLVLAVHSNVTGFTTRATQIDVGDVADVMRRRRDKLQEQRVQANIPLPT